MSRSCAILFALAVVALAGCTPQPPPRPAAVIYGTATQPNSLNPITAPDIVSRSAIEMLFDGLVAADDQLRIRGELAQKWEVSPDGREWSFHLRPGVRWHDGRDLTSADVKFTYDTVIDPNSKPTVSKADYAALQRVEAADPHTVRFHLSKPDASFLSRLVLGIAPRHLLEGQDLATASFSHHPVGTGPFVFESWLQGESLVLKRNDDYFGRKAGLDRLVWKIVPDSNMLALQAANGDVDGAAVASPKEAASLRNSGKMALHESLEGNTQISLQLGNPLFQDVRVRRALAHGIDNRALIDGILLGAAVPATSDLIPTSWAHTPDVPTYPYDVARARALLAEAGWTPGPDGVLARNGKRFEFSLMTYAGHKTMEQVMLAVRQYWAALGLEVKTGVQERNSFVFQRVLPGNFDAVLLQSSVQIDPDLSRRFHSNSMKNGQNFLGYSNPEVDRLLDQGLATNDQAGRREIYARVQRLLAEDLPQLSLFHPKTSYAFKPSLRGVQPSPANLFWNAEEWEWR